MKSVGQMQRQGKGKNVRASAATSGLPTEELDSTALRVKMGETLSCIEFTEQGEKGFSG